MKQKPYRWKAYHPDLGSRVYKNKATAIKFAGTDGYVVDLYKSMIPE